jgi:hypothetical protein
MKKQAFLSLFLILCFVSPFAFAPDLDEVMPHYGPPDCMIAVLPSCFVSFVVGMDGDGLGSIIGPDGNCGYDATVSDPTKNGCEYVTFNGKDKDGKDFSITAQVYIYAGTTTENKAKEISDELNAQSDSTTNDPVVSSAAKGKFTVQPAAGGKITSAEWSNGSGEENNELNELVCKVSATKIKGISTGLNSMGEPSSIMIGLGKYKVQTFIAPNEDHALIMERLKHGLTFLGIKAKLGFDSEGVCWLVWDNPYYKTRFGSNDTGISHMIVSDHSAPSLTDQIQNVTVGRYYISF